MKDIYIKIETPAAKPKKYRAAEPAEANPAYNLGRRIGNFIAWALLAAVFIWALIECVKYGFI